MDSQVERLSVEPIPLRQKTLTPEPVVEMKPDREPDQPPPTPAPVVPRDEVDDVVRVAKLLALALSVRALLALTLLGAFVLALVAMWRGDWMGFAVLGLYCGMTTVPVTILEARKRAA